MKEEKPEYSPATLSSGLLSRIKELEYELRDATGENIVLVAYDEIGNQPQNSNSEPL